MLNAFEKPNDINAYFWIVKITKIKVHSSTENSKI